MSFKSEFKVGGNSYDVVQAHFHLQQKYDHNNKPASGVHGGQIMVILEGSDDGTLGSWIADPTKKQDGRIIFYRADQQDTKFKEVVFEGAYLLTLIENFTIDNQTQQALLLQEDTIDLDVGPDDSKDARITKFCMKDLMECQQQTGQSYCILLRISAEKITIDGVEHQN